MKIEYELLSNLDNDKEEIQFFLLLYQFLSTQKQFLFKVRGKRR